MTPERLASAREWMAGGMLRVLSSAECAELLAEVDRLTAALVAESMGKSVEAAQAIARATHLRNAALAALTAAVDASNCPDDIRAAGLQALRDAAKETT